MASMPSPKQQFLDTFTMEHATTMKVLNAFPKDQGEFRPHPKAKTARELAWNFVIEQGLLSAGLTSTLDLATAFKPAPANFNGIVEQFDSDFKKLADLIKNTPDDKFNTTTVKFLAGPGKIADFPMPQFAWFLLCDQIHHRGQYSVYLRMAGGKVPSIYGPSADEPWM